MFIELVRLKHGDSDLDELIRIHQEPSVSRFLSTSDNYFGSCTFSVGFPIRRAGICEHFVPSQTVDKVRG